MQIWLALPLPRLSLRHAKPTFTPSSDSRSYIKPWIAYSLQIFSNATEVTLHPLSQWATLYLQLHPRQALPTQIVTIWIYTRLSQLMLRSLMFRVWQSEIKINSTFQRSVRMQILSALHVHASKGWPENENRLNKQIWNRSKVTGWKDVFKQGQKFLLRCRILHWDNRTRRQKLLTLKKWGR